MSKPARILVADHEESSLDNLETVLRSSGYQTDRARSGPETLEQVARFQPDLCIIDPMIPGIDGFTVSQQITRLNPSVKVIISTGIYIGDHYRRDARAKYGASEYLEKPYDDQRLLSAVQSLLGPAQSPKETRDLARELEEMLENSLDKLEHPASARPKPSANSRLFSGQAPPRKEEPVGETMRVSPKDLQREMEKIKEEMAGIKPESFGSSGSRERPSSQGGVLTSSDIFGALIKDIEEGTIDEKEFTLAGQNRKKEEKQKTDDAVFKTQPAPPLEERAVIEPRLSTNKEPRRQGGANEYQLLSKIASGGMAEVWKAKLTGEKGFEKIVAVKKILPHLSANEEFITMFTDEAKVAAKLTHPNIAQIYELKIGDPSFIAMEYVSGHTLRRTLNQTRSLGVTIPPEMVAFIGMKPCNALHYAHNKRDYDNAPLNIVHRDVSPQNILISSDGEIKLVDFGIAKASIKATETIAGSLKGKLQYMSPEQGDGKNIDLRSDIFSLGNVLYEALTNRKLFDGNSELAILKNVREARFPRPKDINPAIPDRLEAILLKALSQNQDERYESAKLFEADLKDFMMESKSHINESDIAEYLKALFEKDMEGIGAFGLPASGRNVSAGIILPDRGADHDYVSGNSSDPGRRILFLVIAILAIAVAGLGIWFGFFSGEGASSDPSAGTSEEQSAQTGENGLGPAGQAGANGNGKRELQKLLEERHRKEEELENLKKRKQQ